MRCHWVVTEATLLLLRATNVLAQTSVETAPSVAASGDQSVTPLGIPLPAWVLLIVGTTGSAAIGKGALEGFNSVIDWVKNWSKDYPQRAEADRKRAEADRQRDEMETQELSEQVEFMRTTNLTIKRLNEENALMHSTIITMEGNQAKLLENQTQQALATTEIQRLLIQQETAHKAEISALASNHQAQITGLNNQLAQMRETVDSQTTQLSEARSAAVEWKEQMEKQQARADKYQRLAERLLARLRVYEPNATLEGFLKEETQTSTEVGSSDASASPIVNSGSDRALPDATNAPSLPEEPPLSKGESS